MLNLNDLNQEQREAVQAQEGPVLVLAGAGSGKTRVITFRIAYLLQERLAHPWEVLAVTFTNKAAAEMRQRVCALLGQSIPPELFIGTFHAFGARFLRQHGEAFGRTARYTIYDEDDQSRMVRALLKGMVGPDEAKKHATNSISFIKKVKGNLIAPEAAAVSILSPQKELFAALFNQYEGALRQNNAFDFDDLITLPCRLLESDRQLRESYRRRFRYLLIDEFQDTNLSQGELARLLAAPSGNITAVGDDDQSIYGWRGAHIGNILQFEQNYENVRIFRLERNYRSTQAILDVAHHVIQNNRSRHPKKLWTSRQKGTKPSVLVASDDREEAQRVVERIIELAREKEYNAGDVVILYRTNAQSRTFEDELLRKSMPYLIVGGLRFYERKEVKDFLAYMRLLANANDVLSVQRVINLPPRGIGQKTVDRLSQYATEKNVTVYEAILDVEKIEGIGKRVSEKVLEFGKWIESLRNLAKKETLFKVGERLLRESGLLEYYRKEDAAQFSSREENLSELLNALREYGYASGKLAIEDLEDFLQEVALVTDVDRWNQDDQAVTLMTLHSAKGLEFPVVFLTGLEEGLFPLQNALGEPNEIEEERRLFYVGATRAKDRLFLTYARNRRRWGHEIPWQRPSRFISEINPESLEFENELPSIMLSQEDGIGLFDFMTRKKPSVPARFPAQASQDYPLGSRVKHAQFGEGMVVRKEGRGANLRLLVNFEGIGQKLLLASFARLQVIRD